MVMRSAQSAFFLLHEGCNACALIRKMQYGASAEEN